MLGPMSLLAACCFAIGLAPGLLAPLLGDGVAAWAPELPDAGPRLAALAPLGRVGATGVLLLAALAATAGVLWLRLRKGGVATGPTWGCGYAAPTPRIQYTASSFAQMLVDLFAWVLRPRTHRPRVVGLFPRKTAFHSEVPDPVLDEAVLPAFRLGAWLFARLRVFQQGSTQVYVLYIFLALLALLVWR
jgi:hydrogenase-4 component B